MRRWAVLLLTVAAIAAGCGDDDGDEDATRSVPEAATTATTEATQPQEAVPEGGARSMQEIEDCLADAKLELKPGDEPYTDKKGQRRTRKALSDTGDTYAGYVQWPSERIADVYVTGDAAEAGEVENEAKGFVQAFGLDPATYVRRFGTVVLTFDDPPPSDDEVKTVEDCAG